MKLKLFILFVAAIAGIAFFCFNDKEPESQKKVEDTVHSTAIETVQKALNAAQTQNSKEFAKLSYDFRKNRNGYYECYQLLQTVRPDLNTKWEVRRDANNGSINVSCNLDKNRKLLIVLKTLPDNSMKFAYACTLNA